jgi:hypothetical protein
MNQQPCFPLASCQFPARGSWRGTCRLPRQDNGAVVMTLTQSFDDSLTYAATSPGDSDDNHCEFSVRSAVNDTGVSSLQLRRQRGRTDQQ